MLDNSPASICGKCSNRMVLPELCTTNQQQTTELVDSFVVSVNLLDQQRLQFHMDSKATARDLFDKVCEKLTLKESDIFGLAQRTRTEYHFLSMEDRLSKYLTPMFKRTISGSSSSSLDNSTTSSNSSHGSSFILNQSAWHLNSLAHKLVTNIHSLGHRFSANSSNSYSFKNCYANHGKCEIPMAKYQPLAHDFSPAGVIGKATESSVQSRPCQCDLSVLSLDFRVKFYVADMLLLCTANTRHLYYLQLKQNFLVMNYKLSEEKCFVLASLALVADYGPFDSNRHVGEYFDLKLYFPIWIINQLGSSFIYANLPRLHAQYSQYSQATAQLSFCSELTNDEYPFNSHLYFVQKFKDDSFASISLAIAPKGILVFNSHRSHHIQELSLISTFGWQSVTKINADKKRFEVTISVDTVNTRRYTYYTNCERFSKYLLQLSKMTHAFSMNVFERLADQKTLANYVTESYNETMLSLNNPTEEYEEREVKGDAETNTEKKGIDNNLEQLTENLSSSSISSSSSTSYCEQPLANQTAEPIANTTSHHLDIVGQESFLKANTTTPPATPNTSRKNSSLSTTDNTNTSTSSRSNSNRSQLSDLSMSKAKTETSNTDNHSTTDLTSKEPEESSGSDMTIDPFRNVFENFNASSNHVSSLALPPANLTYRQTFSGPSDLDTAPPKRSVLIGKRSIPPPIHQNVKTSMAPLNNSKIFTLLNNQNISSGIPQPPSQAPAYTNNGSATNTSSSSSRTNSFNTSNSNQILLLQNEYQKNQPAFNKSHSFMSDSSSSNRSDDLVNPPYIKYKKPPTYEESLKKMRKYSNSSYNVTNNSELNGSDTSSINSDLELSIKLKLKDSDSDEANENNNRIGLSMENLESIRMKAASLSLPLLTALCSDKDLIESICKSNSEETSYF